jgi:hypothetical protein
MATVAVLFRSLTVEAAVSACSFACLVAVWVTAVTTWLFAALPVEASLPAHVCDAFASAALKVTAGKAVGSTGVASGPALFVDVDAIRTQLLVQVAGHNYLLRSRIVYRRKMLNLRGLWNGRFLGRVGLGG